LVDWCRFRRVPGSAAGDEIHLEVPTSPDLLRLVRVVASGVASRLGFSIDEVDDVRLAVDELCWTVASRAGAGSTLAVRFVILDAAFTVEARLRPGPGERGEGGPLSALSERILGTLVEDYALLEPADGQGAGFRMRTKQS
jgi:anti-sigma regulatory factor (Ser/Thr protein kinase)